MISYRCPGCDQRLEVPPHAVHDEQRCAACGQTSQVPAAAYHLSRLRVLRAALRERALSADEWREAAVHYRALDHAEAAVEAEQAARRAEPGSSTEASEALAEATANLAAEQPPRGDLAAWWAAAALVAVIVGVAVGLAPAWAPVWLAHGLAALVVAAVAGLEGAPAGWVWLAGGLGGAPVGLLVAWRTRGRAAVRLPAEERLVARAVAGGVAALWLLVALGLVIAGVVRQ